MARTLHADGKTGKVYIYNNAADPAVYETPTGTQLGDLHFHSDLSYLGNAQVIDVTLTHPERTRSSSTSKGLFVCTGCCSQVIFEHVLGSRLFVYGLLIDTRVVALLGLRTRRDLISAKVHDDRKSPQILGA